MKQGSLATSGENFQNFAHFVFRSDYRSGAPKAGAIAGAALQKKVRSEFRSGAPETDLERQLERRSEIFRSAEGLFTILLDSFWSLYSGDQIPVPQCEFRALLWPLSGLEDIWPQI